LLLSVLIPLYNEDEWIGECLRRVLAAPLPPEMGMEIVVVDDASTDQSARVVQEMQSRFPGQIRFVQHLINLGKGAAIRTAISHAAGDFCIFQDADLEYSPTDYIRLLEPLVSGEADCVYGSRFATSERRRVLYYWHSVANRWLTTLCNMISGLNLTDMETCYKAFRTSLLKSIPIRTQRFGIEPEITIKIAQRQARVFEVPISYDGRTYEEGKKIGLKDALEAVFVMLRFGLFRDIYRDSGPEILDVLANAPRFNRWMADTIRPFLGPRVMEIGAGIGNLTVQLARGASRYVATDIDHEHLARLYTRLRHRSNTEIYECDLEHPEHFGAFEGAVDSAICLNVLEHVRDDLTGLRNIYSVLAPGGRAVVLVPEGMSVYGTLDEVLGHYRRYSAAELRSKMEQTGFRVERILEFNRPARPAWYVNGQLLKRRTFNRFQIAVYDRLVWLWRKIDHSLPWPPVSIIAIGVRED
jgi:glycosyltransferase involved in cell wall biosynthesis